MNISISSPNAVAVDAAGTLYIASPLHNRIYVVAPNGLAVAPTGTGESGFAGDGSAATRAQLKAPMAVAVDSTGTSVYIADTGNCRVRKVTGGIITTVAGNGVCASFGDGGPAISAGLGDPQGVAVDSAGNLYITDTGGNRIRKVTGGTITTVAGTGVAGYLGDGVAATTALLNAPHGLAVDGSGNLYIADTFNHMIRKLAGGIITTVVGVGAAGFVADGGSAETAQLQYPRAVAVDGAGNLYIADTNNFRIRKVTGGIITTIAGNGTSGYSGDGGAATSTQLTSVNGIAVNSTGTNLYIADYAINRIRKVTGGIITAVAGNGTVGYSGDGGAATNAQLTPGNLAADSAGNLYISDVSNYRVRKVANNIISTVVGTGVAGYSGDGGPAASAQIGTPSGLAIDVAGSLYLADADNNRIRKVTGNVITTVAGTGVGGALGDGGLATNAQLSAPKSVAVDRGGNLYIADTNNNRIRKVSGGVISLLAGGGPQDGAMATAISVQPHDAALDSSGNVYISSAADHRVYKVAPNGTLSTVAGNGASGYSGDGGPAASAQLYVPVGVAVDAAGSVYIADSYNHRVRKVTGGIITTLAGNGTAGYSGDGGLAAGSQLNYPQAVAVDRAGNVYIADTFNDRVRKISGGMITTVAGGGGAYDNLADGGPATSAMLSRPSGVALDSVGNLYIATFLRIRKVTAGIISTIAGNGSDGSPRNGMAATGEPLGRLGGIAVDASGTNLYIADIVDRKILQVAGGLITTAAGSGAAGFSGDGGAATSALLSGVTGVAVDSAGNLYIADYDNRRVRKVTGGIISTIAGNGLASSSGDGGPALSAQLYAPRGLVVDDAGNLYFSDWIDHVRMISAAGIITTIAGGGTANLGDGGPATSASLYYPSNIALFGGDVYIADQGHDLLRMVSGGVISSVATISSSTSGSYGYSGVGGVTFDAAGRLYLSDPAANVVNIVNGASLSVAVSHRHFLPGTRECHVFRGR